MRLYYNVIHTEAQRRGTAGKAAKHALKRQCGRETTTYPDRTAPNEGPDK